MSVEPNIVVNPSFFRAMATLEVWHDPQVFEESISTSPDHEPRQPCAFRMAQATGNDRCKECVFNVKGRVWKGGTMSGIQESGWY